MHLDYSTQVCKLNKAIYGLRQALRAWYTELKTFLLSLGFTNSQLDNFFFIYHASNHYLYLLVYVDDIVVIGSSSMHVDKFIHALLARFSLKNLGSLSYFLGVEATSTSYGLFLSQRKYITDLFRCTNMQAAKPLSTPLATIKTLKLDDGFSPSNATQYRQVLGSVQYLSLTHTNISFTVNKLSQFMHRPTMQHWAIVKRLLRYLRGTVTYGLLISRQSPKHLHAFVDVDQVGNLDDYTSTTTYVLFLSVNPISWSSKKQRIVACSSTKAKHRVVTSTAGKLNWVLNLLYELATLLPSQLVIYCDNIGAIYLVPTLFFILV